MSYTQFMVVGIDQGVGICNRCGALVPVEAERLHDEYHARHRNQAGPS